eukprot:scpid81697/ scgid5972/ 
MYPQTETTTASNTGYLGTQERSSTELVHSATTPRHIAASTPGAAASSAPGAAASGAAASSAPGAGRSGRTDLPSQRSRHRRQPSISLTQETKFVFCQADEGYASMSSPCAAESDDSPTTDDAALSPVFTASPAPSSRRIETVPTADTCDMISAQACMARRKASIRFSENVRVYLLDSLQSVDMGDADVFEVPAGEFDRRALLRQTGQDRLQARRAALAHNTNYSQLLVTVGVLLVLGLGVMLDLVMRRTESN